MNDDDLLDFAEEAPKPKAPPRRVEPLRYSQPDTPPRGSIEGPLPDRVRDFQIPLALIAGGALVETVATLIHIHAAPGNARGALMALGVDLFVLTGLLLVAALITGKVRGINFGPPPVAMMKLSAVVLGGSGISTLITSVTDFIPVLNFLAALIVPFAAYFTLLGVLFDLEQSDTLYLVIVMFVLGVITTLAISAL